MTALNRRSALAALAGAAVTVPGAAVALPRQTDHEAALRSLIAELRSDNPPESLWRYDARHEHNRPKFLTHATHRCFQLVADRLEEMIGGAI